MDEQRFRLGGKQETAWEPRIVQRLLTKPIPSEEQAVIALIPEREGEHALQAVEALRSLFRVGIEDHFKVGPCGEHVPTRTEVFTQIVSVINFAVGDQMKALVSAGERLLAGNQINDAQTPSSKPNRTISPEATFVWSSVGKGLPHRFKHCPGSRRLLTEAETTSDATHRNTLLPLSRRRLSSAGEQPSYKTPLGDYSMIASKHSRLLLLLLSGIQDQRSQDGLGPTLFFSAAWAGADQIAPHSV